MTISTGTLQFAPQTTPIFRFDQDPTLIKFKQLYNLSFQNLIDLFLKTDEIDTAFFLSHFRYDDDDNVQTELKNNLEKKLATSALSGREYFLLYLSSQENKPSYLEEAIKTFSGAKFFSFEVTHNNHFLNEAANDSDPQALIYLGRKLLNRPKIDDTSESDNDCKDETSNDEAISNDDYQRALHYFHKANNHPSGRAAFEIAQLKEKNHALPNDSKSAEEYYLLAASRGFLFGLSRAAKIAESQNQIGKAAAYFRFAVENSTPLNRRTFFHFYMSFFQKHYSHFEAAYHGTIFSVATYPAHMRKTILKHSDPLKKLFKSFENACRTNHLDTVVSLLACEDHETRLKLFPKLSDDVFNLILTRLQPILERVYDQAESKNSTYEMISTAINQPKHQMPGELIRLITGYCGFGLFHPSEYKDARLEAKKSDQAKPNVSSTRTLTI